MFSVPGWSVPPTALVQEQVKSKRSNIQSGGPTEGKLKKRKRNAEADEVLSATTSFPGLANGKSSRSKHEKPETQKQIPQKPKRDGLGNTHGPDSPHIERVKTVLKHGGKSNAVPQKGSEVREIARKPVENNRSVRQHNRKSDKISTGNELGRASAAIAALPPIPSAKLTPLQAKMRNKLTSARFRHLNETLYTTSSSDALQLFTTSPDLFAEYHAGFAQQVKDSWPQNPVDEYIKVIKKRGEPPETNNGAMLLPRRKTGSCTIADLGCGDAPLARGCQCLIKAYKLKFHNYDLHASNTLITQADMSNLPLRDGEADITVFCLSLMGTNWISFVEEAWRVLRGDGKGEVWISEVKSRFGRVTKGRVVENSVGKRRRIQKSKRQDDQEDHVGPEQFAMDEQTANEPEDETDISAFIKVFTRRGFQLREGSVNKRNKMFVSMIFTKSGIPTAGKYKGLKWTGREYQKQPDAKPKFGVGQKNEEDITPDEEAKALKPCVYKTR